MSVTVIQFDIYYQIYRNRIHLILIKRWKIDWNCIEIKQNKIETKTTMKATRKERLNVIKSLERNTGEWICCDYW